VHFGILKGISTLGTQVNPLAILILVQYLGPATIRDGYPAPKTIYFERLTALLTDYYSLLHILIGLLPALLELNRQAVDRF